jgi:nitrite reductase (NADH) large subunit
MKKSRLVLIGNGMAGVRTLEELLKIAPDLYDITVFGAEPHPNYNRILLSPVLAGEQTIDQIILNPLSWYAEHGITLHTGQEGGADRPHPAPRDRRRRHQADYDRLLIATGSKPFILPVPGKDLAGRDRLPRHRRHAGHDRRRRPGTGTRWSSAAACWGWKPPTA